MRKREERRRELAAKEAEREKCVHIILFHMIMIQHVPLPLWHRELEREAELKEQQRIAEEKRKEEEEYQRMKAEFAVVEGGSVVDDMANEVWHEAPVN